MLDCISVYILIQKQRFWPLFEQKTSVYSVPPEKTCELEITADMYEAYLKPDSMVTIYMKGHVEETKKAYAQIKSFHVSKPQLTLQVCAKYGIPC